MKLIPIQFFRLSRPSMHELLNNSRKMRCEYTFMDGTKQVVEKDDNEKNYWNHVESLFETVEKVGNMENEAYYAFNHLKTDNGEDPKYWIILNVIYIFYNVCYHGNIDFRSFDITKSYNFSTCESAAKRFILPLVYEMLVIQPNSRQYEKILKKIETEASEYLSTNEFPILDDFLDYEHEVRQCYLSTFPISYRDFLPTCNQFLSIDRHSDISPIASWDVLTNGFNKSDISLILELLANKEDGQKVYNEIGKELAELINEYGMMAKSIDGLAKAHSGLARILEEHQFKHKDVEKHIRVLDNITPNDKDMYIPKIVERKKTIPDARYSFIKPSADRKVVVKEINQYILDVCKQYENIERKKGEILLQVFKKCKKDLTRVPIYGEYKEIFGDTMYISAPQYNLAKDKIAIECHLNHK